MKKKIIIKGDLMLIDNMGIRISNECVEIGFFSNDYSLKSGAIFSKESIFISSMIDNLAMKIKKESIEVGFYKDNLINGFIFDEKTSLISDNNKIIDIDFKNNILFYSNEMNFKIKYLINFFIKSFFIDLTNIKFIDDLKNLTLKEKELNVIAYNDNYKICYSLDDSKYIITTKENDNKVFSISENVFSLIKKISFDLKGNAIYLENDISLKFDDCFILKQGPVINKFYLNSPFLSERFSTVIDDIGLNKLYTIEDNIVASDNIKDISSNYKEISNEINDPEKELYELIGLDNIKNQIKRYKNYYLSSMASNNPINLHMVFSGNPGTGKTTVARIIGNIFYKEGILPTNKFIEGSRETLVGEYIGHTAIKTNVAVQKAMGGVLFIDEAYTLGYGGERDFGHEAIDELIKSMEEYKGQFCLILAGYSEEMEKLFNVNMGLKSRIQKNVFFEDYSLENLGKIFDMMLKKESYECEKEAKEMIIKNIYERRKLKNYSNAREVRIAIESLLVIHSERTFDDEEDRLIRVCDVLKLFEENENNKKEISLKCPLISYDDILKYSNKKMDLKEDFDDYLESIVALKVFKNNSIVEATGFIISPDGYAITCAHCVKDTYKFEARRRIKDRRGNQVETYHNCKIALIDNELDLAIIKLDNENNNIFSFLTFPNRDYIPSYLSTVYEMGYPLGVSQMDNLSVHKGYVSSSQLLNNNRKYILDIVATHGASGSCVIGDNGKVIGMIQGEIFDSDKKSGIIYALPFYYILDVLKEVGEKK